MAFRRFRRRFSRRRRRLPETYTVLQCFQCQNMWRDMTCTSPFIDAIELMSFHTPRVPTVNTTPVASPERKRIVVDGIKFQLEMSIDPNSVTRPSNCDPCPDQAAAFIHIWEAIILLPTNQGTESVPTYLPILTNPAFQSGDDADRVLWKRIGTMPYWGINGQNGTNFPNLTDTMRDFGHGPVVVKSKVSIDDRHALFYVRNFFWDLVTGVTTFDEDPCGTSDPTFGVVPLQTDALFKVFYHTR